MNCSICEKPIASGETTVTTGKDVSHITCWFEAHNKPMREQNDLKQDPRRIGFQKREQQPL